MRTLVIVNPGAGQARDAARLRRRLRSAGALDEPEVLFTRGAGDGRRLGEERASDVERLVVVGGDGTFNEVVSGVLDAVGPGAGPVLGLLPAGTGNDLARSLGIPRKLDAALDAFGGWKPRPMDALRMLAPADRWVVNASAGGFSGRVDQALDPQRKRSWGPLAYLRGALDVLPDPTRYRVSLDLDGGDARIEMDAANVVVANGRTAAGGVPVAPGAFLDDGLADLVVLRPGPPRKLLAAVGSGALPGGELDHELVEHRRIRSLRLEGEPPMPFNADGELVGETPLEIRVVPGALRVLAPDDPEAAFAPRGPGS